MSLLKCQHIIDNELKTCSGIVFSSEKYVWRYEILIEFCSTCIKEQLFLRLMRTVEIFHSDES